MPAKMESNLEQAMLQIKELSKIPKPEQRKITYAMGQEHVRLMLPRSMKGINSKNQSFRSYSTVARYFQRKRGVLSKLKPLGKFFNGKKRRRFASGKKAGQLHRSMYLEKGYKEFRDKIGRNDNERLIVTGRMQNNLRVSPYGKTGSVVHYPRHEENLKALGNQERYKFFFPTPTEKRKTQKVGEIELEYYMKKIGFNKK